MSKTDVPELLTSGQVAMVLHKSVSTISRWVRDGTLPAAARVKTANGIYLFDPEVIKQKAVDLALGPEQDPTLDLDIDERRRAS